MLEFEVTLSRQDIEKFRRLMAANRLMAAQSLTFVAGKAVPAWRAGNSIFHRRNTWIDHGVRTRAATPGNLEAQVGTLDRYMARHIIGLGERKEGNLFVPLYKRIADVPTHVRERSMLDRMANTQRKPFKIEAHGETYLARRLGRGRLPLTILGRFTKEVHIEPRLDALKIVSGVVEREFTTTYERLITKWLERGGN